VIGSKTKSQIFFPRSIEGEMANREAARERRQQSNAWHGGDNVMSISSQSNMLGEDYMKSRREGYTVSANGLPFYDATDYPSNSLRKLRVEEIGDETPHDGSFDSPPSVILQPNRRTKDGDVELGNVLRNGALSRHNTILRRSNVNHLVHNWRSPLGK